MRLHPVHCILLVSAIVFSACQSPDSMPAPPESAADARELIVGKKWAVKDMGNLVSSFRENKGDRFVHTITWFSKTSNPGSGEKTILEKFSKATLTLEVNQTPNDGSGNLAYLDGLGLSRKQVYYFTGTQEENANDRTIKLYLNVEDAAGAAVQYPFVILGAGSSGLYLLAPPELQRGNLVLRFQAR